jgi:hypothetical protein
MFKIFLIIPLKNTNFEKYKFCQLPPIVQYVGPWPKGTPHMLIPRIFSTKCGHWPDGKGPYLLQGQCGGAKARKKPVLLRRKPSAERILLQPVQGVDLILLRRREGIRRHSF